MATTGGRRKNFRRAHLTPLPTRWPASPASEMLFCRPLDFFSLRLHVLLDRGGYAFSFDRNLALDVRFIAPQSFYVPLGTLLFVSRSAVNFCGHFAIEALHIVRQPLAELVDTELVNDRHWAWPLRLFFLSAGEAVPLYERCQRRIIHDFG